MSRPEFTTLIGIDEHHLKELRATWPGWAMHKPDVATGRILVVADGSLGTREQIKGMLSFMLPSRVDVLTWNPAPGLFESQRESMLNALVRASHHIDTPYYLKIDTDAHASEPSDWIDPSWFIGTPAFISHRWGYTKPASMIAKLDDWSLDIDELRDESPPVLGYDKTASKVKHPRIISYVFFGNTEFTRNCSNMCDVKLPVPSQDTFLWYCAARMRSHYVRTNMKAKGWDHRRVQV